MDPRLWPLIEGEPGDEVAVLARLRPGGSLPPALRVVSRFENIVSGRVQRRNLLAIRQNGNVVSVKAPLNIKPLDRWGGRDRPAWRGAAGRAAEATGAGACIAIVDWGFDFTHPNFLNEDGSTRLLALWDQRFDPESRGVQPYGYGRLFMPGAINDALETSDPFDALGYDHWGADPQDVGTHGTHVADIAAGVGRIGAGGVAPGSDLIFVHLAKHNRGPRSLGNSVTLFEAVDFVARVAAGRPCVINLSLGGLCGPHDGSSLLEQGFDAAMRQHGNVIIVQSGGNYCRRRVHSSGTVKPGERQRLHWKIDNRDRTENQLDLWYDGRDRLTLTLVSPNNEIVAIARPGDHGALVWKGAQIGRYGHRLNDPNNGDNQVAFVLEARAHGSWQIIIEGDEIATGTYDAWIERDDSAPGSQSTLHAPTNRGTTNSISSGMLPIVVGAYDPETGHRASFSSCGPTRDGRTKPDIHAPGCDIVAAQSLLRDADEHDVTAKTGSSMASPHVAGAVALMIEAAGRPLTAAEVRTALRETARSLPDAGEVGCNGWGLLDIDAAAEFASDDRNFSQLTASEDFEWAAETTPPAYDPMKGRRIPRAVVKDRFGNRMLDLLWREIDEADIPRMAKRLDELIKLTDEIPDNQVESLLRRLEPGGDLHADFEYRLSREGCRIVLDRLRKRWKSPPYQTSSHIKIPVDDPDPGPFMLPIPSVPPPPPPPRRIRLPLDLRPIYSVVEKTKPYQRGVLKYFKVFVWGELESNLKFFGTEADAKEVKLKFESPGYDADKKKWEDHKHQIEKEFNAGIVNIKVEVGKGDPGKFEYNVSVNHKWSLGGREIILEFNPLDHKEFLKTEAEAWKTKREMDLFGVRLEAEFIIKVVIALRWDWWKLIEDAIKRRVRRIFDWVLRGLKGTLMRLIARKLFLAAGAGLLAWMMSKLGGSAGGGAAGGPAAGSPPAKLGQGSPYDPPQGDAVGDKAARQIAGSTIPDAKLTANIQRVAALNRRAYAEGAGAAIKRLVSQQNAQVLSEFVNRPQPVDSWQTDPPRIKDVAKAWQQWTQTRPTPQANMAKQEYVKLATDDFRYRLRVAEKALVIGEVLYRRNLIELPSLNLIKGVALQQSTIAGFAAAVQLVREFINSETYEYYNMDGVLVKQDGAMIWSLVGSGISSLGFSERALIEHVGLYMLLRLGRLRN